MANDQKTAKIREALKNLDPLNVKHWTDDGLPRESVVREFAGDQSISRKEISDAFPGFQRTKPKGDVPVEGEPAVAAAPTDKIDEGKPADYDPITGDPPQAGPESYAGDLTKNTGDPMSEDEVRDVLEARVVAAEHAIADAQQGVRDAHALVAQRQTELQEASAELRREFPPLTQAQNVKEFIASEQAMREARVSGNRQPARIDLVMQRSNSRGWRRPSRVGRVATSPVPSERPSA